MNEGALQKSLYKWYRPLEIRMDFIPEQAQQVKDVPYFDDVTAQDGWQGHTTDKSIDTLKSEVIVSISRLGGLVSGFQKGTFVIGDKKREGFRIYYTVEMTREEMIPGRLDIAALPVDESPRKRRTLDTRREKSLKMALYMLRSALDGTWFLQQLSPGYAPLMPWMLERTSGKTISQLWNERSFSNLLPPGDSEFVEGEFESE